MPRLDDLLVHLPAEPAPPGLALRICRAVRAQAHSEYPFFFDRRARQAGWGLEALSLLLFGLILGEMAGGSLNLLIQSFVDGWNRLAGALPPTDWAFLHSLWDGIQALGVTALPLALASVALGAFLLAASSPLPWANLERSIRERSGNSLPSP